MWMTLNSRKSQKLLRKTLSTMKAASGIKNWTMKLGWSPSVWYGFRMTQLIWKCACVPLHMPVQLDIAVLNRLRLLSKNPSFGQRYCRTLQPLLPHELIVYRQLEGERYHVRLVLLCTRQSRKTIFRLIILQFLRVLSTKIESKCCGTTILATHDFFQQQIVSWTSCSCNRGLKRRPRGSQIVNFGRPYIF